MDSVPSLQAWSESLGDISYPLLSDFYPHGQVAQQYGVLMEDGRSERAIFVIDKAGFIRYIDHHDIDDQPDNEELFKALLEIEPDAAVMLDKKVESEGLKESASTESESLPSVDLYCTAWCPACRRARIYLKSHRIKFNEINITDDREAAERVREWTGGNETSPTFDIQGTIVVDFDRERLDEIFGFDR